MPITEIIGWIGMILVLIAYYAISFKKVTGQSALYQLLNLFGVIGIGVNVFAQKAWPVFVLECIWGTISLVSLIKIIRKKS